MEHIKKKLVFHFYIGKEGIYTECNLLHFKCLEHYASDVFDKVVFTIAVDDLEQQKSDVIALEEKITGIFKTQELEFKVVGNTYLRDTKTFYDEIATKLNETEELVLFAHNKGTTNVKTFEKKSIFKWIAAMYFAVFDNIEEVEHSLTELRLAAYGGLLNILSQYYIENYPATAASLGKNAFLYTGTFFWINPKTVCSYMTNNNIPMPEINDRWYAENFLANIVPSDLCTSPKDWRALNFIGAHSNIMDLIDLSFHSESKVKLNKFYEEIGIEGKKDTLIEIVYIATNNYINYLKDFLSTLKNFYPGAKKILKVITNNEIIVKSPCEDVIRCEVIKTFDLFYPCINLHKAKFIEQLSFDPDADYVFYFDADTRFIENPNYNWEDLKDSMDKGFFIMSLHPIYLIKDEEFKQSFISNLMVGGITDKDPHFASSIPSETYDYVISSFFCGKKDTMKHVCGGINNMIMEDMVWQKWYHIPRFSDENYFNKLVYNRANDIDQTYCIRIGFFTCIEELDNEIPDTVFLYQKGQDEKFKSAKR